jgi:hypothetical protein
VDTSRRADTVSVGDPAKKAGKISYWRRAVNHHLGRNALCGPPPLAPAQAWAQNQRFISNLLNWLKKTGMQAAPPGVDFACG